MPCQLETKSAVNWDVCPAIEAAQVTIAHVYLDAGTKAVVTWCQCDPMIFNTPTEYEGWLASIPQPPDHTESAS